MKDKKKNIRNWKIIICQSNEEMIQNRKLIILIGSTWIPNGQNKKTKKIQDKYKIFKSNEKP